MNKAGFEHEITELRLGLPGRTTTRDSDHEREKNNEKKRVFGDITTGGGGGGGGTTEDRRKTAAVGWPPVCSYRRRSIGSEKECVEASKRLVKISMDGVPFLRKVDVSGYKDYSDFVASVEKLFGQALKEADSSDYVPIYEDKDGDWLLVGDVPWNMFAESCKRLRIMKRSDAKGFELQSKKRCHG